MLKLLAAAVEDYEKAEECLNVNYYGAKKVIGALVPFLQLSHSPRIVNVSSSAGKLQVNKNVPFFLLGFIT